MKKKAIFISGCETQSNTSASIRNMRFVSGLSNYCYTISIEFCLNEKKRTSIKSDAHEHYIIKVPSIISSPKSTKGVNFSGRLKKNLIAFLKRLVPDNYSFFCLRCDISNLVKDVKDVDYVFLNSDPKGIYYLFFNKSFKTLMSNNPRARIISIWGDPWYFDINSKRSKLIRFFEYLFLKKSNVITYNTKKSLSQQKASFRRFASKMVYLPRTIPDDFITPEPNDSNDFREINLLYAGDFFSRSRNIKPLYATAKNCSYLNLRVFGNTDLDLESDDNVKIYSRVDNFIVDNEIEKSDILIVLLNVSGGQLPGKLFDYAITGKHVIVLYENIVDVDLIPMSSRFIFLENKSEVIEDYLYSLYTGQKKLKRISYVEVEEFKSSNVIKKYLEEVNRVN